MSNATSPASSGSLKNKAVSFMKEKTEKAGSYMPGFVLFLSMIMFFISFGLFANYSGSDDRWVHLQNQVQKVLALTIVGTILFTIAALMYFTQDPTNAIYFVIIVSCVSLGLSYSALGIGAISLK